MALGETLPHANVSQKYLVLSRKRVTRVLSHARICKASRAAATGAGESDVEKIKLLALFLR